MKTELTLSPAPIDEAALAKARSTSDGMGAVVSFSGVVRGLEEAPLVRGRDLTWEHDAGEATPLAGARP